MVSKSITEKKTNETVKRELLNSLKENDDVEEQGLNETLHNVSNPHEAMLIIGCYEDIIKKKKKKKKESNRVYWYISCITSVFYF